MTVKQWLNKCTYLDSNINSEGGKNQWKRSIPEYKRFINFTSLKKEYQGEKNPKQNNLLKHILNQHQHIVTEQWETKQKSKQWIKKLKLSL